MDSWGAYGRHWQRNQTRTIQDFIDEPEVSIELTSYQYDGKKEPEHITRPDFTHSIYHFDDQLAENRIEHTEYSYTISLFHWLDKYFDLATDDPFVLSFNRLRKGSHYYLEDRQEAYLESIHHEKGDTHNSYNGETNLSQVYQLTPIFPIGDGCSRDFDSTEYYLLSIHQGCDVRGGYTNDIMVKIDPNDFPREDVYGTITYTDWTTFGISNIYDGIRLRHDELQCTMLTEEWEKLLNEEIDPDRIQSIALYL